MSQFTKWFQTFFWFVFQIAKYLGQPAALVPAKPYQRDRGSRNEHDLLP
jgi:hypothetical protein